jgi:hypothetical protein
MKTFCYHVLTSKKREDKMEQTKDPIIVKTSPETKETENWITIKDAADLLNHSETHIWRIIEEEGWETTKEKINSRKKSLVLRKVVEDYDKKRKARHSIEPLENSNKQSLNKESTNKSLDITGIDLSDIAKTREMIGEFVKNHELMLTDTANTKAKIIKVEKTAATWRVSTFSVIGIALVSVFILSLWLHDTKNMLSDKSQATDGLSKEITDLKIQLTQALTKLDFSKNNGFGFNKDDREYSFGLIGSLK